MSLHELAPPRVANQEQIVAELEKYLARARRGEIFSIAVAALEAEGWTSSSHVLSSARDAMTLIGCLQWLASTIVERVAAEE